MTNEQIAEELKKEAKKYTSTIPQKKGGGYTSLEKGMNNLSNSLPDASEFVDFLNDKLVEIFKKNNIQQTEEERSKFMEYMNPIFTNLIGEFVEFPKL